jgi:hypothetical protein
MDLTTVSPRHSSESRSEGYVIDPLSATHNRHLTRTAHRFGMGKAGGAKVGCDG